MICEWCDTEGATIDLPYIYKDENDEPAAKTVWYHRECMIRQTMGGIGHLIAHQYWCVKYSDPDGGLNRWESAQLAAAYVRIVAPHGPDAHEGTHEDGEAEEDHSAGTGDVGGDEGLPTGL